MFANQLFEFEMRLVGTEVASTGPPPSQQVEGLGAPQALPSPNLIWRSLEWIRI